MYSEIGIIIVTIVQCWSDAEYEIFKGFENYKETSSKTSLYLTTESSLLIPSFLAQDKLMSSSFSSTNRQLTSTPITALNKNMYLKPMVEHNKQTKRKKLNVTSANNISVLSTPKEIKFNCPEEETPSNIGAYEVPTQRDFVLMVRKKLSNIFDAYHKKVFFFLRDMKEASKGTIQIEKKCPVKSRQLYKKCVKHVAIQCEVLTKKLVISLEAQRKDFEGFTNGTICNMAALRGDPLQLIKFLAMEKISLEFALPGFLRLLSSCTTYCNKNDYKSENFKKPARHMTDQDLVVKHFLTRKNYIQLLKDQK